MGVDRDDLTPPVEASRAAARPDPSAHLLALVEDSDDAIISTRLDGTITSWNRGAEALYGYLAHEAIGSNISIVYPEADASVPAAILERIARGESIRFAERWRRRRDGTTVRVELRIAPIPDLTGAIVGASAIARDVSERTEREAELRESRAFLERTQEVGHIGSWQTGIGPEPLLKMTAEARRILGIGQERELRNLDFFNLVHPEDRQLFAEILIRTRLERIRSELELRVVLPEHGLRWLFLAVEAITDNDGVPVGTAGVIQDITERKAAEAALEHDALHDLLTGLPNRLLFLDRLERALAHNPSARPKVAVLVADLDRFELFNDTQGHDRGDALLQAVARRLASSVTPADTVSRVAADEFVLLIEDVQSAVEAADVAARTLALFDAPFDLDGTPTYVTASVGVVIGEPGADPEGLVRDADLAMYRAKEQGRNRFELYDATLRRQAEQRVALEARLRHALDNGELFLEYQPVVSLAEDRFTGAEALLRWRHPDQGVLLPSEFIDVAEETGLIVGIGAWVLGEACRVLRKWRERTERAGELRMSINVSPLQLRHEGFVETLADAIATAEIPGSLLRLELTESVLVGGASVDEVLTRVRELGPHLVIDDFGIAYSALSYLTRLPIEELKIDRSFVENAVDDESDRAVVAAIIALGQSLHLHVTAEGVENRAQLELLRQLGCDAVQGHYFAESKSAEECFEILLARPSSQPH